MESIQKTLKELGLKDNEISIYISALSLGSQPASVLGKKTGISRSNTQYICAKLQEKCLLSMVETPSGNIYSPEEPEKILSMLNKEYNKLDRKMEKAHSIISDLKQLKNPHTNIPKVKYFTGVDGIIDMFEDVLKSKNDVYGVLQLGESMHHEILKYLNTDYSPRRNNLGIQAFSIFNNMPEAKQVIESSKNINRHMCLVEKSDYPIESCMQIYGTKVAFYSYKTDDLTGIIIDNENIAKTQKALFDSLWSIGKKIS